MLQYKFFPTCIFFLIPFFLNGYCYCNSNTEQCPNKELLTSLCDKLLLSHFSEEQRINNIGLHEQAYTTVLSEYENIKTYTDNLPHLLHLTYKLANSFQQCNRGAEAEIILRLAYNTFEKCLPHIHQRPPSETSEILWQTAPCLPSLYAAVLHFFGKSYFYRVPTSPIEDEKLLNQTEGLVERSLEIRKWIDQNLGRCIEPFDSGIKPYCSHTILFTRTQGYFYLEKGNLGSSRKLYEEIFKTVGDEFEHTLASLQLIKIYTKLAHQECQLEKIRSYYSMAYEKAQQIKFFLAINHFSGWPIAGLILAEFYSDRQNPYYNIIEAKNILEKILLHKKTFSQDRLMAVSKKLGEIYEKLAYLLKEQAEQFENKNRENYFAVKTCKLTPFSNRLENIIALASLYRSQKQYLQATLLISNALFQNHPSSLLTSQQSEELWFQLYLVQKEFEDSIHPAHQRGLNVQTFSNFKASILRYKDAIKITRENFKQQLTIETCWETHRQLAQDFQQIYKKIFNELIGSFILPPTNFAILGLGSLAREIPSPYSDFEFALVYDNDVTHDGRLYFEELSTGFLLKLIALGETPIPLFKWNPPNSLDTSNIEVIEGLRPDAGGAISHSFGHSSNLQGTVSELLQKTSLNTIWQHEFSRAQLIFGSSDIFLALKNQTREDLLKASKETKAQFFCEDRLLHTPPIIKVNSEGLRCYSIKHSFLRGLILLLYNRAWFHSIIEDSPQTTLEALERCGEINDAQKNNIDHFLKQLIYRRSCQYLEYKGQVEDCVILNRELDEIFDHIHSFNQIIDVLCDKHLLKDHKEGIIKDKELTRIRSLHRAGLLQLAEISIQQQIQTSSQSVELLELQGDNALMQSKTHLAYNSFLQGLNLDPSNNLLRFKLIEAVIILNHLEEAKIHLNTLENGLNKNNDRIQLKVKYFKILIARLEKDWEGVDSLFQKHENKKLAMSGNLVHALFELEKGRYQNHLGNKLTAKKHFEIAKGLIIRRYGPLHPSMLPVYEELINLKDDNVEKNNLYSERINTIKKLFPNIYWPVAIESNLLD